MFTPALEFIRWTQPLPVAAAIILITAGVIVLMIRAKNPMAHSAIPATTLFALGLMALLAHPFLWAASHLLEAS